MAVGQVVKGDKADKSQMAELNEGTITDLCELEGDEYAGADCHVEVKVPSPCSASAYKVGLGTKAGGGCYASVGHLYALGNTEERYRNGILGVKQKGHKCEGPFNHATGRGYVKAQEGKYRHALAQGARSGHSAHRRDHGRHLSPSVRVYRVSRQARARLPRTRRHHVWPPPGQPYFLLCPPHAAPLEGSGVRQR